MNNQNRSCMAWLAHYNLDSIQVRKTSGHRFDPRPGHPFPSLLYYRFCVKIICPPLVQVSNEKCRLTCGEMVSIGYKPEEDFHSSITGHPFFSHNMCGAAILDKSFSVPLSNETNSYMLPGKSSKHFLL